MLPEGRRLAGPGALIFFSIYHFRMHMEEVVGKFNELKVERHEGN